MKLKLKLSSESGKPTLGDCPSYAVSGLCFVASLGVYLLSSVLSVTPGWSQQDISLTLAGATLVIGVVLAVSARSLSVAKTLALLALPVAFGGVAYERSVSLESCSFNATGLRLLEAVP